MTTTKDDHQFNLSLHGHLTQARTSGIRQENGATRAPRTHSSLLLFLVVGMLAGCGGGAGENKNTQNGNEQPGAGAPPAPNPNPPATTPAPAPAPASDPKPAAETPPHPVTQARLSADPLEKFQWHLRNDGGNGMLAGIDVNVENVWRSGIKGQGVTIGIIDDGIEILHEDLHENIQRSASYNYVTEGKDPTPPAGTAADPIGHGTAVAGLLAAQEQNGIGIRGIAPAAKLAGFGVTLNPTAANLADAMVRNADVVAVSNNSWSQDPDDTGELYPPSSVWKAAVNTGTIGGRGGKGLIYVWAAGNGGSNNIDNSNYDGMANDRHVMAVCAVGPDGKQAIYSEPGANLWVCAPSAGGDLFKSGVTTTDRMGGAAGYNTDALDDYANRNYTRKFGGTSSAVPLVSGVAALMLEANPLLSWRDVRLILAQTARKIDPQHQDWARTAGGTKYNINHQYGFGLVDAEAAVTLAKTWVPVGPEQIIGPETAEVKLSIPDNNPQGVTSSIQVAENLTLEFAEVTFNAPDHTYLADLEITLTAPSGTKSILAQQHDCYTKSEAGLMPVKCTSRYDNWTFGVARVLGENAQGKWTLHVADRSARDKGTFVSWALRLYGR